MLAKATKQVAFVESGTGAYAAIQGGGFPGVIGFADLAAGTVDVRHGGSVSLG
jgi:hypothetical protein